MLLSRYPLELDPQVELDATGEIGRRRRLTFDQRGGVFPFKANRDGTRSCSKSLRREQGMAAV